MPPFAEVAHGVANRRRKINHPATPPAIEPMRPVMKTANRPHKLPMSNTPQSQVITMPSANPRSPPAGTHAMIATLPAAVIGARARKAANSPHKMVTVNMNTPNPIRSRPSRCTKRAARAIHFSRRPATGPRSVHVVELSYHHRNVVLAAYLVGASDELPTRLLGIGFGLKDRRDVLVGQHFRKPVGAQQD